MFWPASPLHLFGSPGTISHTAPPDSRPSAAARALDGQNGFLAALRARNAPLPAFQPVARIALPAQADHFELRARRSYAWSEQMVVRPYRDK